MYFQFGNLLTGWLFYKKHNIDFVRASNEVYFQRRMVKTYLSNFHHCWMSMEGMSEAYNETWRESEAVEIFKDFLNKNKNVGNHFNRNLKSDKNGEDICSSIREGFNKNKNK